MTAMFALMCVCLALLSIAGIGGVAALGIKGLRQYIADLQKEDGELRDEMKALYAAGRANEGGKRTAAQDKRLGEIKERLNAISLLLSEANDELKNEEIIQARERNAPGIEVGDDLAVEKPWGANAMDAFGSFMNAVVEAGKPSGRIDKRLLKGSASGGSTGASGDAGFLVQKDQSDMLMNRVQESSVLLPLCDTVEISANSDALEAPYIGETSRADGARFGGVQVYRRKEAATVTATKPEYRLFEIRLEDLMGITYVTGRQLADARASGQVLSRAYGSETAFRIDREIIRGQGAGEMTGVLAAGCLVTQDKEATQAADTIVQANLSKMWARFHPRSRSSPNARLLYNAECDPQLDGMYTPAGIGGVEPRFITYDAQGVARFKGVRLQAIEQASALGDLGDVILFDGSQYLIVKKGGTQEDSSIHVRFLYDEMAIRFITRINGKPKWDSAITPYKGSATLSPFVTLQAR